MHFGITLLIFIVTNVSAAEVFLSVLSGTTALLHCEHDPGSTVVMITWQVHLLYPPRCSISSTDTKSFNNCSERMINKNRSLEILKTRSTDQGNYICEVVNDTGTFCNLIRLEILVQPSVSLENNTDGFPECWAAGGNPAANISWIPDSENVTTRRELQPDNTWTVISTYGAKLHNWSELTCEVSHPAFIHPQRKTITMSDTVIHIGALYVWILVPIALAILFGLIFYWRRTQLRTCTSTGIQKDNAESKEDIQPYESYVQKVNTIYSSVPGS